jgi:TRAP-type C4-dicarboxylate transport system substrate-binding protein
MRLIFTTEYPKGALPGEALSVFCELANNAGGSSLTVEPQFESSLSSFSTVSGEKAGVAGGIVFGSSLLPHSKEFELAAIPRGSKRSGLDQDIKRFQSNFENCLHREGFLLLAIVAMPPTGIWSRREIDGAASLAGLRIRTYDALSQEVFSSIGCTATHLPFARLRAALDAGELDAVLSSGDGAAGDLLAHHFANYLPVSYSTPLCFLVVRWATLRWLSMRARTTLKWAGRELQFQYRIHQADREEKNLTAIQNRGVKVIRSLPADVMDLLEQKMEQVRRRVIAEHTAAGVFNGIT